MVPFVPLLFCESPVSVKENPDSKKDFSHNMKIYLSHSLETVWVSASPKLFKKAKNLEFLCFPMLFPYYGNSIFSFFGKSMDFCFILNILRSLSLWICLCFPYFFPCNMVNHFFHFLENAFVLPWQF